MQSTIRSDAAWVAIAQVFGVVSGFLLAVVAAESVGRDGFAVLVWLLATLTYFASLARFGSMQAAARVVHNEHSGRNDVVALLAVPVGLAALVSALWFAFLESALVGRLEDRALYEEVAPLVALWLPVATIAPTIGSIMRAVGRFSAAAAVGDWVRRVALIVPLLVLGGTSLELLRRAAIFALAVEYAVMMLAVVWLLRNSVGSPSGRSLG